MVNMLKIAGFLILGIIVLVLISAAIVKKQYSVEREVSINKPKQFVFDFVKLLKNQNQFSVWAKIDPNMKVDFRGTDGTVGFVSAWDSDVKEAGQGEQEITKIEEGVKIDYEIRFMKPRKSESNAFLSFISLNDSTTNVKWNINGTFPYPMNLMLAFMNMDKMLGKDLEGGLNNLKALLENK
jgi:hypothetical protein